MRPNQTAGELRDHYRRTTAIDRLREVAELSRVQTALAASGTTARNPRTLDFFALVRSLLEHEVEFVLIGGFALGFHGAPRGTKGADIVPDPSHANLTRLWRALESLAAVPVDTPVAFTLDGLLEGGNWALDTRLGRLDLMLEVAGVESYDELRAEAVEAELPEVGRPLWIAGREDRVTMKQEAGRPQDLIDVQTLRMAEGLEE